MLRSPVSLIQIKSCCVYKGKRVDIKSSTVDAKSNAGNVKTVLKALDCTPKAL